MIVPAGRAMLPSASQPPLLSPAGRACSAWRTAATARCWRSAGTTPRRCWTSSRHPRPCSRSTPRPGPPRGRRRRRCRHRCPPGRAAPAARRCPCRCRAPPHTRGGAAWAGSGGREEGDGRRRPGVIATKRPGGVGAREALGCLPRIGTGDEGVVGWGEERGWDCVWGGCEVQVPRRACSVTRPGDRRRAEVADDDLVRAPATTTDAAARLRGPSWCPRPCRRRRPGPAGALTPGPATFAVTHTRVPALTEVLPTLTLTDVAAFRTGPSRPRSHVAGVSARLAGGHPHREPRAAVARRHRYDDPVRRRSAPRPAATGSRGRSPALLQVPVVSPDPRARRGRCRTPAGARTEVRPRCCPGLRSRVPRAWGRAAGSATACRTASALPATSVEEYCTVWSPYPFDHHGPAAGDLPGAAVDPDRVVATPLTASVAAKASVARSAPRPRALAPPPSSVSARWRRSRPRACASPWRCRRRRSPGRTARAGPRR